jgi:hypothetical protein
MTSPVNRDKYAMLDRGNVQLTFKLIKTVIISEMKIIYYYLFINRTFERFSHILKEG